MRRALVAAMVAGLCLVGPGPAWGAFPGQNGRIAYTTGPDPFNPTIHTILPGGRGDRELISGTQPFWSPNGRRLAFVGGAGGDIYTIRADGSGLRQLTFDGDNLRPIYSPSGGRIAFTHVEGTTFMTTMRTDGSDRHVLGKSVATAWSPDGRWISCYCVKRGIGVMRPNGSHLHRLVRLGKHGGYGPIYSPDGRKFIFTRTHSGLSGDWRGFIANSSGGNVRPAPCPGHFRSKTPLTYSPDGRRLLMERQPTGSDTTRTTLFRLSLASCRKSKLVGSAGLEAASWQALR